jgi:hypothetical protein
MDEITKKLKEIEWSWADKDFKSLEILEGRIAKKGRDLGLITYSDLVFGVSFTIPGYTNGTRPICEHNLV